MTATTLNESKSKRANKGFASIGLMTPKYGCNVGGVIRSAAAFNAASVVISGQRCGNFVKHPANTSRADRNIPIYRCDNLLDFRPYGAEIVVVDLIKGAVPLNNFTHPKVGYYLFGPEDGTLGGELLSKAQHKIYVPTSDCLNLSTCVSMVLYDRQSKGGKSFEKYNGIKPIFE